VQQVGRTTISHHHYLPRCFVFVLVVVVMRSYLPSSQQVLQLLRLRMPGKPNDTERS
jgi:hypothetical protein